ncbi:ubiquitin conjugating enzyme [Sclerotinia borealis F-4128]|uniref:Ubiquitin-conjugating enzyme E2 1 n=1 Tax=Sclerotinia borealis (strain F-4128) TaxID=1432307 RepID=W9C957_SCLBF|nr:ubiquitin conjugating enzyme [Sclerotinia borealis F-4128]
MSSNRVRRIAKELNDISNDADSQIFCQSRDGNDSDLTNLRASFSGPPDTPYEGGTYIVDIKIPNEYPFRPPQMNFTTKLWHPNVSSQTGAICLDTLGSAWSPVLTIRSALLSLQSLLSTPEPKDPQDAEVANMLLYHPDRFRAKARDWAIQYAGAPSVTKWSQSAASIPSYSAPVLHRSKEEEAQQEMLKYQGYNKALVDRFVSMGFDIEKVVEAFNFVHIDRNDGEDYELEEAYMGDVTARLLGEP